MDNPEVAKYIEQLKSEDWFGRRNAAEALGEMRDASAVLALIDTLQDKNLGVRFHAVWALGKIGDASTLPRKILAHPKMTAQEKVACLDQLRTVHYSDSDPRLYFDFPDTRTLCRQVLSEDDVQAREGAEAVLRWLDGEQHLVRASQRDATAEGEELLRAAQGNNAAASPETLLRAAEPTDALAVETRSWWQRLRGK